MGPKVGWIQANGQIYINGPAIAIERLFIHLDPSLADPPNGRWTCGNLDWSDKELVPSGRHRHPRTLSDKQKSTDGSAERWKLYGRHQASLRRRRRKRTPQIANCSAKPVSGFVGEYVCKQAGNKDIIRAWTLHSARQISSCRVLWIPPW